MQRLGEVVALKRGEADVGDIEVKHRGKVPDNALRRPSCRHDRGPPPGCLGLGQQLDDDAGPGGRAEKVR